MICIAVDLRRSRLGEPFLNNNFLIRRTGAPGCDASLTLTAQRPYLAHGLFVSTTTTPVCGPPVMAGVVCGACSPVMANGVPVFTLGFLVWEHTFYSKSSSSIAVERMGPLLNCATSCCKLSTMACNRFTSAKTATAGGDCAVNGDGVAPDPWPRTLSHFFLTSSSCRTV